MSDFWAEKLGIRPANRSSSSNYTPSRRPWWDEPPYPSPQPQQPHQQDPQQYPQQQSRQDQPVYAPWQAKSARLTERCPECNSANYMAPVPEGPTVFGHARYRCFDCGYPYEQTGSGAYGTVGAGEATPARQIHDGTSQILPGHIAHI